MIGNGMSVGQHNIGHIIDNFDVVARFNRYKTIGFEPIVGTKTTDWIVMDSATQWFDKAYKDVEASSVIETFNNIYICIPKFKFAGELNRINHLPLEEQRRNMLHPKIQIVDTNAEDEINTVVNFTPAWPTTGLIAMTLFTHMYEDIYIHGFDGHSKDYKGYHYFEPDDPMRSSKYAWREGRTDHNMTKENQYIQYMIQSEKVKVLTDHL